LRFRSRFARPALAAKLILLASLAAAADARPADDLTIEHQGVARHYLLHRAATDVPARPLVIYLHGLRPVGWQNHPQPEFDAAADREGFVVVYPEAVEHRWSYTGQLSEPVKLGDQVVDDVGFVAGLIDQLAERKIADERRVYVIGESRGGLMTFELMCRLADRIAAAAPLITGMTEGQRDSCGPTRAVPLFAVDGTSDPVQRYDGWLYPTGRLLSVPETMEFWRRRHGCIGQEAISVPHRIASDPTRLLLVEWTGCAAEDAVRLYRIDGGGHHVPSFTPPPDENWAKEFGRQSQDIETIGEFWSFAKRFSR
jgi:polyhydroxybutyrate depolymerase